MRSLNLNLVKITLLACFFIGLLVPGALALQNLYTVPSTPGASCWASGTGSFFDSTYYISLTRPETDVHTGLMFQGLNISQSELVNNATLRLYFDIEFEPGEVGATIYGYDQVTGATYFTTSAQLRSGPFTASLVDMNLTGISSPGWREYDVTDIVQEIINRPYWNISDNLGFIIQGASGQEHRTIVSNVLQPSRWPQLNITWAESPTGGAPGGEPYNSSYRGYNIYSGYTGEFSGFIANNKLYHYSYEAPIGWDEYDLPQLQGTNSNEQASEKGWMVGNKLYLLLCNTTRVDLWYANTSDLSSWSHLGALRTVQAIDYNMVYNEAENCLYCFHLDYNGPAYYRVYNITSGAWNSATTLYISTGGYVGTGLDSCYDPDNEYVWTGTATPDTSGSMRHYYIHYWAGGTPTLHTKVGPVYGNNHDMSNVDYYNEKIWFFYVELTQTKLRTIPTDTLALSGATTIVSDTLLYSETVVTPAPVYRLWLIMDYPSTDQQKRVFRWDTWDTMTVMSPRANYTGQDQLIAQKFQFYGAEWLLLEMEQNDNIYWFQSPGTLSAGSPFKDPDYWSYYESGLNFNWARYGGIGSDPGAYTWYVDPGPNPAPDPSCLAQATTLEEVQACIDAAMGGADPLDPDPPGWSDDDDPEYLTRPLVIRFFLFIGLALLILPFVWLVKTGQWASWSAVIFLQLVGAALLLYMAQI